MNVVTVLLTSTTPTFFFLHTACGSLCWGGVGSTGELDVEAGNGDVDGLRVEGVGGVGDGVIFRIGVEGVLGAVLGTRCGCGWVWGVKK